MWKLNGPKYGKLIYILSFGTVGGTNFGLRILSRNLFVNVCTVCVGKPLS